MRLGAIGMVATTGPLLAEDAYLLVKFDRRDRQVIVTTKVCRDLPDRPLNEPPQPQICIDMNTAREFALEVAASRSLPVIWDGAEFCASVVYIGNGWQASWAIRHGAFVLEADMTMYRDEDSARVMVKADARNRRYEGQIRWIDGYTEARAVVGAM
jgi:hypothetical protein